MPDSAVRGLQQRPLVSRQVIASAAGTIIAVANPALSMSQLAQPPAALVAKVKTEPGSRVKVEPAGSPPAANGRRPAD